MDIVKWYLYICRIYKVGFVVKYFRENFNVEMCIQVWIKFYEILNIFDFILEDV